jgi:hypothetical protein
MMLSDAEQRFLTRQPRGHLSTIGPDGTPQVKPLGFACNVDPDNPGLRARDIVADGTRPHVA